MSASQKILIVEDELNARQGLAELISGWGYRTETAEDGLEALERIQSFQPSIVLTDLKMPNMDGLQLLTQLQEQPSQAGRGDADRAGHHRQRRRIHAARRV